ncbi:Clp protease [Sphaerisporangium rufum]|uniref:Clp protease n=1 Tax=Sphaerisporangium rufum TaxID=1381558 RepID=A0A919R619_9ACTN|nr:Clp protease [Sphaerisporangium rufum]
MFERFHQDARQAVVLAQAEARLLDDEHIGTEHVLLGLLRQPDSVAGRVLVGHGLDHDRVADRIGRLRTTGRRADELDAAALESIGIDLDSVREKVEATFGPGALDRAPRARRRRFGGHIPFTKRAKKVLELSLREAVNLRHDHIGTGHILLGMIREGQGLAARVLVDLDVDLQELRTATRAAMT